MSDNDAATYEQISERLDKIVETVRKKDTSLERSLDLFDEAIELGSRAVDLVDKVDFSATAPEGGDAPVEGDTPSDEPVPADADGAEEPSDGQAEA